MKLVGVLLLSQLQLATSMSGPGYVDVVADFGVDNTGVMDAAPGVRAIFLLRNSNIIAGELHKAKAKYFTVLSGMLPTPSIYVDVRDCCDVVHRRCVQHCSTSLTIKVAEVLCFSDLVRTSLVTK